MKKSLLTSILLCTFLFTFGQTVPYSSLHENFDASCGFGGLPNYWRVFTPPMMPAAGQWQCTSTHGRPSTTGSVTAGVECTGTIAGTFTLDTSYLATPLLDLPWGATDVYFQFDCKAVPVLPDLAVIIHDSTSISDSSPGIDISASIVPPLGARDTIWTTHEVNLTSHVAAGPFYIGFRYVSNTTSGNIWYVDNVNTSISSVTLSAKSINPLSLKLGIKGSSESEVTISYQAPEPGQYAITLYDILGRILVSEKVDAATGPQLYTIRSLALHDGMYFVKMADGRNYSTAKFMVR